VPDDESQGLPGAWCVETLGERGGALVYFPLIPRADAKLLAIEVLRAREGWSPWS